MLRREDIVESLKYLMKVEHGVGTIDDIDHLGNRRVRLFPPTATGAVSQRSLAGGEGSKRENDRSKCAEQGRSNAA